MTDLSTHIDAAISGRLAAVRNVWSAEGVPT